MGNEASTVHVAAKPIGGPTGRPTGRPAGKRGESVVKTLKLHKHWTFTSLAKVLGKRKLPSNLPREEWKAQKMADMRLAAEFIMAIEDIRDSVVVIKTEGVDFGAEAPNVRSPVRDALDVFIHKVHTGATSPAARELHEFAVEQKFYLPHLRNGVFPASNKYFLMSDLESGIDSRRAAKEFAGVVPADFVINELLDAKAAPDRKVPLVMHRRKRRLAPVAPAVAPVPAPVAAPVVPAVPPAPPITVPPVLQTQENLIRQIRRLQLDQARRAQESTRTVSDLKGQVADLESELRAASETEGDLRARLAAAAAAGVAPPDPGARAAMDQEIRQLQRALDTALLRRRETEDDIQELIRIVTERDREAAENAQTQAEVIVSLQAQLLDFQQYVAPGGFDGGDVDDSPPLQYVSAASSPVPSWPGTPDSDDEYMSTRSSARSATRAAAAPPPPPAATYQPAAADSPEVRTLRKAIEVMEKKLVTEQKLRLEAEKKAATQQQVAQAQPEGAPAALEWANPFVSTVEPGTPFKNLAEVADIFSAETEFEARLKFVQARDQLTGMGLQYYLAEPNFSVSDRWAEGLVANQDTRETGAMILAMSPKDRYVQWMRNVREDEYDDYVELLKNIENYNEVANGGDKVPLDWVYGADEQERRTRLRDTEIDPDLTEKANDDAYKYLTRAHPKIAPFFSRLINVTSKDRLDAVLPGVVADMVKPENNVDPRLLLQGDRVQRLNKFRLRNPDLQSWVSKVRGKDAADTNRLALLVEPEFVATYHRPGREVNETYWEGVDALYEVPEGLDLGARVGRIIADEDGNQFPRYLSPQIILEGDNLFPYDPSFSGKRALASAAASSTLQVASNPILAKYRAFLMGLGDISESLSFPRPGGGIDNYTPIYHRLARLLAIQEGVDIEHALGEEEIPFRKSFPLTEATFPDVVKIYWKGGNNPDMAALKQAIAGLRLTSTDEGADVKVPLSDRNALEAKLRVVYDRVDGTREMAIEEGAAFLNETYGATTTRESIARYVGAYTEMYEKVYAFSLVRSSITESVFKLVWQKNPWEISPGRTNEEILAPSAGSYASKAPFVREEAKEQLLKWARTVDTDIILLHLFSTDVVPRGIEATSRHAAAFKSAFDPMAKQLSNGTLAFENYGKYWPFDIIATYGRIFSRIGVLNVKSPVNFSMKPGVEKVAVTPGVFKFDHLKKEVSNMEFMVMRGQTPPPLNEIKPIVAAWYQNALKRDGKGLLDARFAEDERWTGIDPKVKAFGENVYKALDKVVAGATAAALNQTKPPGTRDVLNVIEALAPREIGFYDEMKKDGEFKAMAEASKQNITDFIAFRAYFLTEARWKGIKEAEFAAKQPGVGGPEQPVQQTAASARFKAARVTRAKRVRSSKTAVEFASVFVDAPSVSGSPRSYELMLYSDRDERVFRGGFDVDEGIPWPAALKTKTGMEAVRPYILRGGSGEFKVGHLRNMVDRLPEISGLLEKLEWRYAGIKNKVRNAVSSWVATGTLVPITETFLRRHTVNERLQFGRTAVLVLKMIVLGMERSHIEALHPLSFENVEIHFADVYSKYRLRMDTWAATSTLDHVPEAHYRSLWAALRNASRDMPALGAKSFRPILDKHEAEGLYILTKLADVMQRRRRAVRIYDASGTPTAYDEMNAVFADFTKILARFNTHVEAVKTLAVDFIASAHEYGSRIFDEAQFDMLGFENFEWFEDIMVRHSDERRNFIRFLRVFMEHREEIAAVAGSFVQLSPRDDAFKSWDSMLSGLAESARRLTLFITIDPAAVDPSKDTPERYTQIANTLARGHNIVSKAVYMHVAGQQLFVVDT